MASDIRQAGYKVACAYDGIQALECTIKQRPDLIILDYQMPKLDGNDLIRLIRGKGIKIPIIMVTIHHSNEIHIQCLKLGGNDYLTHPIDRGVLLAHIETRLQEKQGHMQQEKAAILQFADIEIHSQTYSAYRDSHALPLTPIEYKLLRFFLQNPYCVLEREQILKHVWGVAAAVELNTVDVHVGGLRKKLEARGSRLIQTVRGVGYVLKTSDDKP